jgi:hypothetical protein
VHFSSHSHSPELLDVDSSRAPPCYHYPLFSPTHLSLSALVPHTQPNPLIRNHLCNKRSVLTSPVFSSLAKASPPAHAFRLDILLQEHFRVGKHAWRAFHPSSLFLTNHNHASQVFQVAYFIVAILMIARIIVTQRLDSSTIRICNFTFRS